MLHAPRCDPTIAAAATAADHPLVQNSKLCPSVAVWTVKTFSLDDQQRWYSVLIWGFDVAECVSGSDHYCCMVECASWSDHCCCMVECASGSDHCCCMVERVPSKPFEAIRGVISSAAPASTIHCQVWLDKCQGTTDYGLLAVGSIVDSEASLSWL